MSITLGQLSSLCQMINEDEVLQKHFIADYDTCFTKLENITEEDKRHFNNFKKYGHRFKLNGLMVKYGFEQKNKPFDQFFSFREAEQQEAERFGDYKSFRVVI